MADDFEKENSNFSFDENSNKAPDKVNAPDWSDNPFEKEAENPFAGQTQYQVSNENIDANRRQSNNLLKVLLALVLSIGLLIAAIFGLSQKKSPTENTSKNLETKTQEVQTQAPAVPPSLSSKPAPESNFKNRNYCKLSEAQLFISSAIGDLDRVTGKVEDRMAVYKVPGEEASNKETTFLRNKVEDLSRAESEILNFSQPYMDSDLSIGYKSILEPCKLEDASKYLAVWMDELKERINSLHTDLDELSGDSINSLEESAPIAVTNQTEKTVKQASSEVKQSNFKADSGKVGTVNLSPVIKPSSPQFTASQANQKAIINKPSTISKPRTPAYTESKIKLNKPSENKISSEINYPGNINQSEAKVPKEQKQILVPQTNASPVPNYGRAENQAYKNTPIENQGHQEVDNKRTEQPCFEYYEDNSSFCSEYEEYYYYEQPAPRSFFQWKKGYCY